MAAPKSRKVHLQDSKHFNLEEMKWIVKQFHLGKTAESVKRAFFKEKELNGEKLTRAEERMLDGQKFTRVLDRFNKTGILWPSTGIQSAEYRQKQREKAIQQAKEAEEWFNAHASDDDNDAVNAAMNTAGNAANSDEDENADFRDEEEEELPDLDLHPFENSESDENDDDDEVGAIEVLPPPTIRSGSAALGIPYSTLHKILRSREYCDLYPYKLRVKQELSETHKAGRLEFAKWALSQPEGFEQCILVSDEKWWWLRRIPNLQNERSWRKKGKPPKKVMASKKQGGLKLMCSTWLLDGQILYQHWFVTKEGKPQNVTGEVYLDLVKNHIWPRILQRYATKEEKKKDDPEFRPSQATDQGDRSDDDMFEFSSQFASQVAVTEPELSEPMSFDLIEGDADENADNRRFRSRPILSESARFLSSSSDDDDNFNEDLNEEENCGRRLRLGDIWFQQGKLQCKFNMTLFFYFFVCFCRRSTSARDK